MDSSTARKYFPHINNKIIYFNHAAFGPVSSIVKKDIEDYLTEQSELKPDDVSGLIRNIRESKTELASLINTTTDRIAYLDNTSNGINILAQGIDWKKGDRVLLNNVEFPANVYPFLNLKNDVKVDFVKSDEGIVSADKIIENIKPGTRLISVSQVQFLSGYRVDLEKIGKVCAEKEIIFSVDAIQGLGAVRLDVEKWKIDFVACGTQKWLLGQPGMALIYISQKLQQQLKPKVIGWFSVKNPFDHLNYNQELKTTADYFQTGSLNTIGIYALNSSLQFLKKYGYDNIENNITGNSVYFMKRLAELGIKPVLLNREKRFLSGIVSFKYPGEERIFKHLSAKNIHFALREGILRFSPHFYNNKDEIDTVIAELKTVL
jgi:selenocysteine lyase/cysteine desulfurase